MIILNGDIDLNAFFLKLSSSSGSLLILDYDGTLAPFVKQPEKAVPYPGVCERIKKIMRSNGANVVIMSGRSIDSLKKLLPLSPLPELWGSHGGERLKTGSDKPVIKQIEPDCLSSLSNAAALAAASAPDLLCETKPLSVALHWREKEGAACDREKKIVIEGWKRIAAGTALEIHAFDGGVELRVKGINKGEAVKTLLQEAPKGTVAAYLGDDFTDEEAFSCLNEDGLKVLVRHGERPTLADILLLPPGELLCFLDQWIDSIRKTQ